MSLDISNKHIHLVTSAIAWEYKIVPKDIINDTLILCIDKSICNDNIIDTLEVILDHKIELLKLESDTINNLLAKYYRQKIEHVDVNPSNSTNTFLQKIILEAHELKSSDIHVEAYSDLKRIRFRIDGKLIERYRIPNEQYSSFINKIKIKSQLDIAEKRLPQDGRMMVVSDSLKIDIRVSILPSLYGEKVVLRLLNTNAESISLDKIGLSELQLIEYTKILRKPHGIILISGPTGSGKTTTLYATLKLLNNEQNNILTIEDPIEYTLKGINQVQLRENIGLTFAKALKTFLRQDPDIIMLGEIRDPDTAQMAIRAALTGHLVLSTIHTNSAWDTIARLLDMGIPNYLLASTLNLTAAQRLIRTLCNKCKSKQHATPNEMQLLCETSQSSFTHYVPVGCSECYYTGYSGRVAIFEIIPIDIEATQFIKDNSLDTNSYINSKKHCLLKDRAIELIKEGRTSIDEAYPILSQ